MSAPAKPFGRRNPPAPPSKSLASDRRVAVSALSEPGPSASAAAETSETFLQLTAALAAERRKANQETSTAGAWVVPKSARAALLAGLVVACLHASLDLGTAIALGQRVGRIAIAGQNLPIVPLILLGSLWSGARSSVIGLFFVRTLLAPLQMTHIAAYTLCGGLVALVYALVTQALGWGDPATLPVDSAMGLAAGFFYRLFAGTRQV